MSLVDTSYLSLQDRATLGEDARYLPEVTTHRPTVFFRPGDRTYASSPGYWIADENDRRYLGFISKYGSHESKTSPEFLERMPVEVVDRTAKPLCAVTEEEFKKTYAEIDSHAALNAWLQQKYPTQKIDPDTIITVYTILYV